jgi:hypothetical protein
MKAPDVQHTANVADGVAPLTGDEMITVVHSFSDHLAMASPLRICPWAVRRGRKSQLTSTATIHGLSSIGSMLTASATPPCPTASARNDELMRGGGGTGVGGDGIWRVACRRCFNEDGESTRNSEQRGNARQWSEQLQNLDSPRRLRRRGGRPDSWFQLEVCSCA